RDFIPLYELAKTTTIGQARARAVEVFGDTEAIEVVDSVKELVRLDRLGAQALEEEKKGWKEKSEQERGLLVQQQLSRQKQERELFDKVNQEFQNGIEAFRDLPEDKEASALRKTGYDQFEALISRTPKDVSQKLQWGAHVKQRFAAFEPNQLTIKRQADKIAALEAQIAGLKPATPGGGKITPTGGDGAGKADDSMDSWAKGAKTAVEAV
ncbi:MAG TPA: hypothetical protein VMQ67_08035, partial [Candidatus Saccharimonadales bacterium]|nr:hypothetical protein [Candidatus Saccharimonadales bacterium]